MLRLVASVTGLLLVVGCGSSGTAAADAGVPDATPADTSAASDGPGREAPLLPDLALEDAFPDVAFEDAREPPDFLPPAIDAAALVDGESGPADAFAGQAVGKLCHELNRGGQPVTLTLEFGDPPVARITAATGRCAPTPGTPCTLIPAGEVPVRLLEGDKLLTSRVVVLESGMEYLFQAIIDANLQVAITGGRIDAGTCSGLDYPAADAGGVD